MLHTTIVRIACPVALTLSMFAMSGGEAGASPSVTGQVFGGRLVDIEQRGGSSPSFPPPSATNCARTSVSSSTSATRASLRREATPRVARPLRCH